MVVTVVCLLLITPCTDGGTPAMDIAVAEALADPLNQMVMDPAIRGKTDRVVLKYRRAD